MNTLTVCVITKHEICATTTTSLLRLMTMPKLPNMNVQIVIHAGQSDLPKARSLRVTEWYDKAKMGDFFLFVDADQTFTEQDVFRSLEYMKHYDIVCGVYSRKDGGLASQPIDLVSFLRMKEGNLLYGATGFMMFSYKTVDHVIEGLLKKKKVYCSMTETVYPLFFERMAIEKQIGYPELWLSEDYSFCWLVRQLGGRIYGYISSTIGHDVPNVKYAEIPTSKIWPDRSIAYVCGETVESWSPENIKNGIGGSETAVIKLSKYWASKGYKVTVFCSCEETKVYDGVSYRHMREFTPNDVFDILILWRDISMLSFMKPIANKVYGDMHDLFRPNSITVTNIQNVTKVCCKSKFHASLIQNAEDKVCHVSNGGAYDVSKKVEKDKNYIIYASSYDRGLAYMLKWGWPKIKKACPDAYLRLYYGWDLFDKMHGNDPEKILFKNTIVELMKQDGIEECGRVSQEFLEAEKRKANIHWYVGDFGEIDCITVRESASAGAIPVVSGEIPVFKEKEYCLTVDGNPRTKQAQEKGAEMVIKLLQDEKFAEEQREKIYNSSIASETWENVAEWWIKNLFEVEEKEEEYKV